MCMYACHSAVLYHGCLARVAGLLISKRMNENRFFAFIIRVKGRGLDGEFFLFTLIITGLSL